MQKKKCSGHWSPATDPTYRTQQPDVFEKRRSFIHLVLLNRMFQPCSVNKAVRVFSTSIKDHTLGGLGTPLFCNTVFDTACRGLSGVSAGISRCLSVMLTPPDSWLLTQSRHVRNYHWNAPGDPRWSTWTWIPWTLNICWVFVQVSSSWTEATVQFSRCIVIVINWLPSPVYLTVLPVSLAFKPVDRT